MHLIKIQNTDHGTKISQYWNVFKMVEIFHLKEYLKVVKSKIVLYIESVQIRLDALDVNKVITEEL